MVVTVRRAETENDLAGVARLGADYAAWDVAESEKLGLSADDLLGFQHDYRIATLREKYLNGPDVMFIALDREDVVGCGALRPEGPRVAEIKTFYVDPASRGQGIGRVIVDALVAEAGARGLLTLRIETVLFMESAIAFYRRVGFQPCAPYYDIPASFLPITLFMELRLPG